MPVRGEADEMGVNERARGRRRSERHWPEGDRRVEMRMLCADLIEVWWTEPGGQGQRTAANLEDISFSGACLQMDRAVAANTVLHLQHPRAELTGRVCYCVFRETGYFVGLKFAPGYKWNRRRFQPKHLLDPRRLVALTLKKNLRDGE